MTGFGEETSKFIDQIEKIVSIGVIPYITPVRSIPGKPNLPISDHKELLDVYRKTAELMRKYGVNPLLNKAGCVKCGGCSAINEAFKAT